MNLVTLKAGAKLGLLFNKPVSGVKVYLRQDKNFKTHAVNEGSDSIGQK
jgi:hypothetical protein